MGTKHQDVIEINGKKYNAVTGQLIKEPTSGATAEVVTPIQPKPSIQHSGVVLDGFKRPDKSTQRTSVQNHPKNIQKSHTLMRQTVKKPTATPHTSKVASSPAIHAPKVGPTPQRMQAASDIKKSPHVSKYGGVAHSSSVIKKVEPLEVKKQQPKAAVHSTIAPVSQSAGHAHSQRTSATSAHIERSLAHATAHEAHALPTTHMRKHKKLAHKLGISARTLAASSTVLAGVLLGGFFAVQNVPNLSMRVAAARAGFSAEMPNYNPSGFSYKGPIQYSPGQVTISFRSNTDDRSYSVTQKSSNWNSDALLSNYIVASNKQYQTYQDRGRTLYIYDGSNATWVNNGVWYQVEGNSGMTTDQLVRIASSI